MTSGFFSATLKDYDSESANMRVHTTVLSAANWAAEATARGDFESGIVAMSSGNLQSYRYGNRVPVATGKATFVQAQREIKMLVQFHDATTGERNSVEIPCPKLTALDPGDHAHFYIGDGDIVDAFTDAFEAYVLSLAGNAVVVDELSLVGRKL